MWTESAALSPRGIYEFFFFSSPLVLNWDNLPLLSPFKSLFSFMSQPVSRSALSVKQVVTFLCFSFLFQLLFHFIYCIFLYYLSYSNSVFSLLLHLCVTHKFSVSLSFLSLKASWIKISPPCGSVGSRGELCRHNAAIEGEKGAFNLLFLCAKAQFHAAFIVCGKLQLYIMSLIQ